MVGLYPSFNAFWSIYLTCILIAMSATGYGYMISALAPTIEAANALAPPLMVPLLLFGGFFLQTDSVPTYFLWLKYISWFYYGAENLYVSQWKDGGACYKTVKGIPDLVVAIGNETSQCVPRDMFDCSCLVAESGNQYNYVSGESILDTFSYKVSNYWRNVACLCALAVGYRLVGYFVLVYKFRNANR